MHGIELVGVTKRFGSVEVIGNLDLQIDTGEFLVILGPSGCGKSTLLRMIAGLEPVTAGEVRISGRDATQLRPGARGVAMVFQHYALYPHMTVYDNLAFGMRNVGVAASEIERRIGEAARILELEPYLARKPAQLRRVRLAPDRATAWHLDPSEATHVRRHRVGVAARAPRGNSGAAAGVGLPCGRSWPRSPS